MRNIDFSKIKDIDGIAKYFYSDPKFIRAILESSNQKEFYSKFKIPKKGYNNRGKFRTVYKGNSKISQLQKNIATEIEKVSSFPSYVQGFVKGRSTKSNAEKHLESSYILNADIKDFFDHILIGQVNEVFISLGCGKMESSILAKICTINGVLCQGLHTSPILSNLVVKKLDLDIQSLTKKYSSEYTRYSDDITISSKDKLPSKNEISKILQKHGFSLNKNKFKITKRGQYQYVTGLSVFDSQYPRIPKLMKKNIRLSLYYINKYGLENHLEKLEIPDFAINFYMNNLKGHIDYINAIEPIVAQKMYKLLPSKFSENTAIKKLSEIMVGPSINDIKEKNKIYKSKIKQIEKLKDYGNPKIKQFKKTISDIFKKDINKNNK